MWCVKTQESLFAVIQWITCKSIIYDLAGSKSLARIGNVNDNNRVNSAFSSRSNVHFEGDKDPF